MQLKEKQDKIPSLRPRELQYPRSRTEHLPLLPFPHLAQAGEVRQRPRPLHAPAPTTRGRSTLPTLGN